MSVLRASQTSRLRGRHHGTVQGRTDAIAAKPLTYGASARLFRTAVLGQLAKLERGRLTIQDACGTSEFGGQEASGQNATMVIRDPRFYRAALLGGGLGAAESYLRGHWETEDLTMLMRVFAMNWKVLSGVEKTGGRWLEPLRSAANWLRRNTPTGSKRNIAAHYDLSNDFFQLMLDPTMTYSSGVFPDAGASLESASIEKYDRICRKLQLRPCDHVMEIGTGWGGFAHHAAQHYGCRVTTTTISEAQHQYAAQRFRDSSLTDRVTLLKHDYRDLTGQFDKLVSIEMIEAVGEKFLPGYFAKCSDLLKPDGMMLLQGITIPDHRYDRYRRSVDFIRRYIFPGGFLPSMGAISGCLASHTDFRVLHLEDFGAHYAATLNRWHDNFHQHLDQVRALGFDDRFVRMWDYYLSYCEAGFLERQIGVAQLLLTKPDCRREPLLFDV